MSMQSDQIRESLRQAPFRPFVIHLADGRQLAVRHPDFAMLSPTGRVFMVFDQTDIAHRIDTLLITSLSDPPGDGRASTF